MAAVAIALVCTIPWVPAAWRGLRVTSSTRSLAVRWLEANLPADAAVLTEAQGPPLRSHRTIEDLRSSEWYAVASAAARDRVDRARGWNVVTLPLFVEGSLDLIGSLPDGRPIRAVVIPEAADLSKVFYVPRLLAGADVIITSSAVRGRYEQAVPRFERQVAAYRVLDRWMPAVEFRAPFGSDQPTIRIYRLADGARAEFESMEPELDPAWWMEAVPADTWSALLERNAFPTDAGRIFFADHMDPFLRAWGAAVRGRPLAREIERVRAFWSSPAR